MASEILQNGRIFVILAWILRFLRGILAKIVNFELGTSAILVWDSAILA